MFHVVYAYNSEIVCPNKILHINKNDQHKISYKMARVSDSKKIVLQVNVK